MSISHNWTKEKVIAGLEKQKDISWIYLRKHKPQLLAAAEKLFGSLRKAVEALGKDYDEITKRKPINKKWVIKDIHAFVSSGDALSSLYTIHSNLMRKSKRVFGSVSRAFQVAGYHYEELNGHRGIASKWPEKNDLLKAIRKLPSTYHETLHRKHRGLEARAEKLFGSWPKAVEAAGLRHEHVPPPVWPGELILKMIRRLRDKSHGANVDTRLYYSARTAFGSWRYAVELAGFPYYEVEPRFLWRPKEVLYYIRWLEEKGQALDRDDHPDLYKFALRFFGSCRNAVRVAQHEPPSIHFKHRLKRPRERKSNSEIAKEMA